MADRRLLESLVRAYSPSGSERRAVRAFVAGARRLGYRTRVDAAGNGIAEHGSGRPVVLFLGHIDTVEGERPVRWRAGRLHGRGVVDAKGALAAALEAGADLPNRGTLRIVGAVREETDSAGARHLLRGPRPDFVIAGEPSGWDGVTVGYKGILRAEATFRGRRRHYSVAGGTAADRAVDWIAHARRWAMEHAGSTPFRSVTVAVIRLRDRSEGDAESATVGVDIRLPPGVPVADARAALATGDPPPRLRELSVAEPYDGGTANPVVGALLGAIREGGARPTVWRKAGTSDLNVVAAAWGIPGAAYGPGDARLDHTARESLSVAELDRSIRVLRLGFGALLGAPPADVTPRRPVGGA